MKPLTILDTTPDIEIDIHSVKIGAGLRFIDLATDIPCMNDELSLWHGGENGFDDCRIDVIHDLFKKGGM